MRTRILSILAYTGAGLTLLVAVCVPFVLIGAFTNVVAHAGLHIDATYSAARLRGRSSETDTGSRSISRYGRACWSESNLLCRLCSSRQTRCPHA